MYKYTALKTIRIQDRTFISLELYFVKYQMEIVWQTSMSNELLPNALYHITDFTSSYLALSLTDLALSLASTTKSFKFMSPLSGGSGIPPASSAVLFIKSLHCNKKQ